MRYQQLTKETAMNNPTASNWNDFINALPTPPVRTAVQTEWMAKFSAMIGTNAFIPVTVPDMLLSPRFFLNRERKPRPENQHYNNQTNVNDALNVAAAVTDSQVETPLAVPDQWSFMESNPRLGNGLADFSFNFDAWRLPESNEIPRQRLRTELDYEMQNLIQAMGSFKACREQRIAADGPVSAPCQASTVLNLFGQG